mmetsp:Transcript_17585/g.24450  ORF Transcript_17585/g.24450 Transcript_17585/m.24450 type:complete len:89 (-) Transcript_17585:2026-2292(-)
MFVPSCAKEVSRLPFRLPPTCNVQCLTVSRMSQQCSMSTLVLQIFLNCSGALCRLCTAPRCSVIRCWRFVPDVKIAELKNNKTQITIN